MRNINLKVLLIEDDDVDREAVARVLQAPYSHKTDQDFLLRSVSSIALAVDLLRAESFDCILLDLSLPDTAGLDGLKKLHSDHPAIPIIVLTGLDDSDAALQALSFGAQDYLVKGRDQQSLKRAISYAVERQRALVELSDAREQAVIATRAKSQFLANISHELRTPLTAIIGFGEVLLESEVDSETRINVSKTIVRNSKYLLDILNDLLDFSKIEAKKAEVNSLDFCPLSAIKEVCDLLKVKALEKGSVANKDGGFPSPRVRLELEQSTPLPDRINSDPLRFKQILFNLIGNAIKFTEEGFVKVVVSCDFELELLWLQVQDTGIGIESEDLEIIFEAFSQASDSPRHFSGGTGLGLTICKQLVTLLGGTIAVESTPGKGSVFTCSFSTGAINDSPDLHSFGDRAAALEPACQLESLELSGHILLVDDNADIRNLILYHLNKTDVQCDLAINGEEGVHKTLENSYDLVLMDMQMPVLDGAAATAVLREKGFSLPIIALTATSGLISNNFYIEAGFTDYLRKPFSHHEFLALLAKYLNNASRTNTELSQNVRTESDKENDTYTDIIRIYLDKLPAKLSMIQHSFETKNWELLVETSHQLASAEMFGFARLGKTAQALELAAENRLDKEARILVTSLIDDCAHALNSL